jgi:regulatory protein
VFRSKPDRRSKRPKSAPDGELTRPEPRRERPTRPLDPEKLDELAIAYVGRFATTRQKLARYLTRKLAERGWDHETLPDTAAIVGRLAGYGFIDDAAFAEMKARSLSRRGYGKRRVDAAVREAGVAEPDRAGADTIATDARLASALRMAERRRWGPYASDPITDPKLREKRIATFIRAGHDARLARAILAIDPGGDVSGLE